MRDFRWNTKDPDELQLQLRAFAEEVAMEISALERGLRYNGKDVQGMGPGDFAESSSPGHLILLRAPSKRDVWKEAAVSRVVSSGSVTVRAVGCRLNGSRDGYVTRSSIGMLWFRVVDSSAGPEWVTT